MQDVLRPVLPQLSDEIIAAIARDVPGYRRAMEGTFGAFVRLGVETALGRFVEGAEIGPARDTYVNLGRGEFHAGRSLDALLGAYRVGARLAWRRFVEAGVAGGLDPGDLYDLGEAIFAYIDELSAASVEGFAEEQSRAAGEAERRRRRLVAALGDPAVSGEVVRSAAADAGWPLPRAVAALVVARGEDAEILDAIAQRAARRIGVDAIGAALEDAAVVWVADPDAPGRALLLERAAVGDEGDTGAVLGPTGALARAGVSLRRALAAWPLRGTGLLRAAEHLPALLYAADPALAAELSADRLAPLDTLAAGPRARLAETLRAWLDRPGQVTAVAAALDVHPQTVRYRLRQLRELFGERLEDPDARFELALALRVSGARGPG